MTNSELVLYFANKYIIEREKNILLQQKLNQQKQIQDDNKVKANVNRN